MDDPDSEKFDLCRACHIDLPCQMAVATSCGEVSRARNHTEIGVVSIALISKSYTNIYNYNRVCVLISENLYSCVNFLEYIATSQFIESNMALFKNAVL